MGVYGDVNKIAAARFLALANGVQGLGYKRTQIDAVEYDEDPDTGVDTPSFLGSTGIRAFVIPGLHYRAAHPWTRYFPSSKIN